MKRRLFLSTRIYRQIGKINDGLKKIEILRVLCNVRSSTGQWQKKKVIGEYLSSMSCILYILYSVCLFIIYAGCTGFRNFEVMFSVLIVDKQLKEVLKVVIKFRDSKI